jgi:hypothetical protein
MESLNLDKFSPKKAELVTLTLEAAKVVINGPDDRAGYDFAQKVRIQLKNARVEIQKTGKALRADALAFQKAVIEKEKELVAIIEPSERDLEAKQNTINEAKEKAKRQLLLPERRAKLQEIAFTAEDDLLLGMDEGQFSEFLNQKKAEYLLEKERVMREEQERIDAERRLLEQQKLADEVQREHQLELEQARKGAEERTKREMQAAADELRKREEAAAAELAKDNVYQQFLKENGYSEAMKDSFVIQRVPNKVTLYRKVAELDI